MNKAEAKWLVEQTFTGDYTPASFEQFISNLFKGQYTPLDKRRDGAYVREAFRSFVQGYRILGAYTDEMGNTLDVLEVTLHRNSSLDRARTAQRNFVADYLKKQGRDAALVAFLSPDQHDWRFSLVKLEYALEVKDGKIKTEEELTPAKRWSFLIGKHEGSHTVRSRFLALLQDEEKPLLQELEEAFNIERVTDEFFKKYCELFFRMKESLDKLVEGDAAIKADFEAKELTTIDFAKKTLGQMAFLYFLQKKGWFGVRSGEAWGTGRKDFLRQLFNRREKYGKNFFDDVLEPLFYEALAQDRGVESIYPRLNNCRMPFLNGGLFEPMNGYSWKTTNIRLPDELFSNSNRTTEGDEGDGILDIFDRYNFTVNESEPLEKEVAVDPEMLGKVFENLLEVKDRKSKGTFYTPREIVHFMCQESLINFLSTELKSTLPREDIEALIRNGSQIIQNDAMVLEKGREGTYKFMLPESVRIRAPQLDLALANVKVCDPAVGSGAFPLGMLNEIVQARQALAVHLRSDQSIFDLKLHSISHSLYGVDIDPGAVEIAKLRLWLALVVEENEPHPLPNLEHKIMQGNSLISEYEGVKLFDESFLEEANHFEKERVHIEARLSELEREYFALHSQDALSPVKKEELGREIRSLTKRKKALNVPNELQGQELSIFDAPGKFQQEQEKAERLQKKIEQYISESQRTKKQQLKEEIEQLKWDLIEASLREQDKLEHLGALKGLRHKNIKPFFIWKLEFSDVFKENGGFDVVVGNPPYGVSIKGDERKMVLSELGKVPDYEIYYFFVQLSKRLLAPAGVKSFIIPNTFLFNVFAAGYRKSLLENWNINLLLDCTAFKLFKAATVHNAITVFQNNLREIPDVGYKNTLDAESFQELAARKTLRISRTDLEVNNVNWGLVFKLPQRITALVKTIRKVSSSIDAQYEISQGYIPYRKSDLVKEYGQIEGTRIVEERLWHSDKKINEEYKEEIFGKSLSPFNYKKTGSFVRYGPHLAGYIELKFFSQKRLLIREITNPKIISCLVDEEFVNDPQIISIIPAFPARKLEPLWAILNSKLATFFHFNASPKATKGAFPKILVKDIREFPLPDWANIEGLTEIVEKTLRAHKEGSKEEVAALLDRIDDLVFDAYGLSDDEKNLVRDTVA